MKLSIVILAAGQGKRMKSDLPKVVQPLAGRPLLRWEDLPGTEAANDETRAWSARCAPAVAMARLAAEYGA